MTAPTLADRILSSIEDTQRLTPHYEPNAVAVEDEGLAAAVLRGLRGPIPDHLRGSALDDPRATAPLMRFANGADAVNLVRSLDAGPPRRRPRWCDRCLKPTDRPTSRLLVPSGASVVAVFCCGRCRVRLSWPERWSTLVWDD